MLFHAFLIYSSYYLFLTVIAVLITNAIIRSKPIDSRSLSTNVREERASPVEFRVLLVTWPSPPYLPPQTSPLDSPFILSRTIPGIPGRHRRVALFLAACWRIQPASSTSIACASFRCIQTVQTCGGRQKERE